MLPTDLLARHATFVCDQCGKCCSAGGDVPLTLEEMESLMSVPHKPKGLNWRAIFVPIPHHEGLYTFKFRNPCMFWDPLTKLCRIYTHRPQACRDYPYKCASTGKYTEEGIRICPQVNRASSGI